jgi:hypothetical protein
MRCHKAQDYISQEMDEHLPPAVTVKLTEHLDSCSHCRDYRDDLLLARRAIAATTPELPDNFEWKLQLKLNRTLQQTAGATAYPWHETDQDKWRWLRNFGAAAAVGMAAILAVAMFVGPVGDGEQDQGSPANVGSPGFVQSTSSGAGDADRLPLFVDRSRRGGLYSPGVQQPVPVGGSVPVGTGMFDRGWAGHDLEDLRTINRLRLENANLNRILFRQQQIIRGMRSQLDTTNSDALDLEKE